MTFRIVLAAILTVFSLMPASADKVTLAVASNFLTTAEALSDAFARDTGHDVVVAHGATGQLYAQILNGAPYDIFLAADAARPARLTEDDRVADRMTYAFGRLVLVSRDQIDLEDAAAGFAGKTVALADPTVAPYGLAATSAMERLQLDTATFRPVLVADVGLVASVFVTGNARIAFLAESQLPKVSAEHVNSLDGLYPPIRQDAVLLRRAAGNPAADAFWAWLSGDTARALIADAGYGLPE